MRRNIVFAIALLAVIITACGNKPEPDNGLRPLPSVGIVGDF